MNNRPRWLSGREEFPHKASVLKALEIGGSLRSDGRDLKADELWGTYQIRLRIAQDLKDSAGSVADLESLVENLKRSPGIIVEVWYVRGVDDERFYIFESAQSGIVLGCLRRPAKSHDT